MSDSAADGWIKRAEEDFESALDLALRRKLPVPNNVCYFCQQSAEKFLKAFLVSQDVPPRRTHSLVSLLTESIAIDPQFQICLILAQTLDAYSVDVRYPGVDITTVEAKEAVKAIKELRRIVRRIMEL